MPTFTWYIDYSPKYLKNFDALSHLPEYYDFVKNGTTSVCNAEAVVPSLIFERFKKSIENLTSDRKDILFAFTLLHQKECIHIYRKIKEYCDLTEYDIRIIINIGRQDLVAEILETQSKYSTYKYNSKTVEGKLEAIKNLYKIVEFYKQQFSEENVHIVFDKSNCINDAKSCSEELIAFFPHLSELQFRPKLFFEFFTTKQAKAIQGTFHYYFYNFQFIEDEIIPIIEELDESDIWQNSYELSHEARKKILEESALNNAVLSKLHNNSEELFDSIIEEGYVNSSFTGLTEEDADLFVSKLTKETRADLLLYIETDPKVTFSVNLPLIKALRKTEAIEISRNYEEDYKVTVLTITYNHEKYLSECIKGVQMQQTNFKVKHIILNNFSSDETPKILHDYAKKHKNIFPIFNYDHSLRSPTSNLLNLAQSEYVIFCDGDDFFTDSHKLQKQVDLLEKNKNYALSFHLSLVKYEDKAEYNYVFPTEKNLPGGKHEQYSLQDLVKRNFFQTSSVLYRWRFKDGLPDWFRTDVIPLDWYLHLLHAEIGELGFIDEIMSVYRRHKASLYSQNEYESMRKHFRIHGMSELETYDVLNKHFEGTFEKEFYSLAETVFLNFLHDSVEGVDESLINNAIKKYPNFARTFINSLSANKEENL